MSRVVAALCFAVAVSVVGGFAACAALAQESAGQPAPASLFVATTKVGTGSQGGPATVVRSRFVEVNDASLRADPAYQPDRIVLNLFDDTVLTATRERVDPASAGYVWIGRIEGAPDSEVSLAVGDGVLLGNIRAGGTVYQVRYAGDGLHTVSQLDPSTFPAD